MCEKDGVGKRSEDGDDMIYQIHIFDGPDKEGKHGFIADWMGWHDKDKFDPKSEQWARKSQVFRTNLDNFLSTSSIAKNVLFTGRAR